MATGADVLSAVLSQLDRIARAPMTAEERALRAESVLGTGLDARYVALAIPTDAPSWNAGKAAEHAVPEDLWLRAMEAAGMAESNTIGDLLQAMRRADNIAEMMKAGYHGLTGWASRGKG